MSQRAREDVIASRLALERGELNWSAVCGCGWESLVNDPIETVIRKVSLHLRAEHTYDSAMTLTIQSSAPPQREHLPLEPAAGAVVEYVPPQPEPPLTVELESEPALGEGPAETEPPPARVS